MPENQEFVAYHGYTIYRLHAESDPERAEDGTAQLKQAIEFSSDQERKLDAGWVLLGMIYVNEENIDSARRCFIQALKINPSNPEATREMKRLQRTKQKEKKSLRLVLGPLQQKG